MGMRQNTWFAIAGVVILGLGGCATGPGTDQAVNQTTEVPIPAPTEGTPAAEQPNDAPTAQATPPAPPQGTLPPELISSTDPNARLQEIRRNRPDPFSLVPTSPVVVQAPQTTPTVSPGATGSVPGVQGGSQPQPNAGTQAQRPQGNGQLAPIPTLVPNRPVPPPPPPTDLARAVKVLGVIQIGSVPHAIVQAPNEPSTRYVRAGQALSNGQVIVRSIDMRGLAPEVVLEQNGVRVVTAVGEGGVPQQPAAAQPASQPAAAQPASQPAAVAIITAQAMPKN
ncbi:MAG TPA: hypothetical protein IGS37_03050 [Synechococcales cyanobacterium M55_K2018_004]|nr:hypothetical protein [Synechococcales cyanobacterium M55_K2018_004]